MPTLFGAVFANGGDIEADFVEVLTWLTAIAHGRESNAWRACRGSGYG